MHDFLTAQLDKTWDNALQREQPSRKRPSFEDVVENITVTGATTLKPPCE
jgi:hypothetical protein